MHLIVNVRTTSTASPCVPPTLDELKYNAVFSVPPPSSRHFHLCSPFRLINVTSCRLILQLHPGGIWTAPCDAKGHVEQNNKLRQKKNGAIAQARVTSALFAFESASVEFMERKKQTGLLKGNANRTSAFISCGEKLFGEDPSTVGDF